MLISLCVSAVPHVLPWEMAAMCNIDMYTAGLDVDQGGPDTDVNVGVYMKYLETLFSQTTPTHSQLFDNNELLRYSINIALLTTPTSDVMDKDGCPL